MRPAGRVEQEPRRHRRRGTPGRPRRVATTASAAAASSAPRRGRWSTFQAGAAEPRDRRPPARAPLNWIASGSTRGDRPSSSAAGIGGDGDDPRPARRGAATADDAGELRGLVDVERAGRARARGSARSHRRRRGPRRGHPSASVTPQIFTNGRRATLAGSVGLAAGRHERARRPRPGRAARISASPTSARIEPERPPAGDGRGLADARLGDDEAVVGDERRAAGSARLGVDLERPQVAVVEADEARVGGERGLQLALVVGLDERLQPEVAARVSTSAREARLAGCRTGEQQDEVRAGGAQDRRAAVRRPRTPWPGPARRPPPGPRAGRRSSRRTSAARTARRSRPRRRPRRRAPGRRCPRPQPAIGPADGDERLTSAIRWRPGAARRSAIGRGGGAAARSAQSAAAAGELGGQVGAAAGGDLRRRRSAVRGLAPRLPRSCRCPRLRRLRPARAAPRPRRPPFGRSRSSSSAASPASIVRAARSIPSSSGLDPPAATKRGPGVEQDDVAPRPGLAAEDGLDVSRRSRPASPPASVASRRARSPSALGVDRRAARRRAAVTS